MKQIKVKGFYSDLGRIEVSNNSVIESVRFLNKHLLDIPFGSSVEITLSYEENDFLTGNDGIVWASYDYRQIEIIQNALLAQNIVTETSARKLVDREIQILIAGNEKDIRDATSFIWKSKEGLKLKPDWSYPDGSINSSFEEWLSGN